MSKLKVISGTVIAADSTKVEKITQSGQGDQAFVTSRTIDHAVLWLASGDKEIPVELDDMSLPVREGHDIAVVVRAGQAIFALNKTSSGWCAQRSALIAWDDAVIFWSLLICAAGVLGLLPLGGGAPIGIWVTLMILCPLPAALLVVRARKAVLEQCWRLVGRQPG
jgi:hypothetical protein